MEFLRKNIISFESKKNTIKQTKNAQKYPKLYEGFSEPIVNNKTKIESKIKLKTIDFLE